MRRALPRLILLWSLPAFAGIFHAASRPAEAIDRRWMVLLAPAVAAPEASAVAQELVGPRGRVERTWRHALVGFLATLSEEDARTLAMHPRVAGVYQDLSLEHPFSAPLPDCSLGVSPAGAPPNPPTPETIVCADPDPQQATATCTDNWGLDRLDQSTITRDGTYAPPRSGQGVHIFLVDSGLYAQHQEFAGRVGLGTDATGGGGAADDCGAWSHGTHVAGIAAGTRFGVAKGATVHPVRVSPCPINIQLSSLVTAFDWIAQAHASTVPGPGVASMSINSATAEFLDPSQPLGVAVAGVLAAGVLVINSAGNNAGDACGHALGVPGALIVGGSDEFDTPWERVPGDPNYAAWCGTDCGSNTGSCVHLFAPAAHIVSSWQGSTPDPRNSCRLSGTSMAAPHAAGAAALFLQAHPTATPAQVKQALIAHANAVLTQLSAGSPNALLSVQEGAAGLALSPSAGVAFGVVTVGVTAAAQRLTVSSTGTLPLVVGTLSLSGAQAPEFHLTFDHCSGFTLAPGATCTVDLTFSPAARGLRSTTLAVPSNDPAQGVTTLSVSGLGDTPASTVMVAVTLEGTGTGTVVSAPAGIACGAGCRASFPLGAAVTLTATASAGSTFQGWRGVSGCTTGPCTFAASSAQTATATFELVAGVDAGPLEGPGDAGAPQTGGDLPDAGPGLVAIHGGVVGCGCSTGGEGAALLGMALALALRRSRKP